MFDKNMKSLNLLANSFFNAFYNKEWRDVSGFAISELSIAEAYQVQDLVAKKRREVGEEVVGFKVGCTSTAIRLQFGLQEPINGRLFQPHIFDENVRLNWKDYINCAIEPEMVLKIDRELSGKNLSDEELIDAIEYVSPGIELHAFKFWHSPPTLQELICSGGIHAGLVIGSSKVSPKELLFKNENFHVYKDGALITSAPASEIMGGPLHSLRWLIKFITEKGETLKRGSLVIPGSPVELVNIYDDTQLRVEIENVGSLVAYFQ
jgi:2-keto-4-pentenoate hydratase